MRESQVQEQMLEDLGAMRYWNEKLQALDPYLQLTKISENSETPGLTAGYWMVLRMKPGIPAVPIETLQFPDGSYREPGSWMITKIESYDLGDDRVVSERKRIEAQQAKDAQYEKLQTRGEIVDEVATIYKARNNPSVRFGGAKWSRDPRSRKK